MEATKSSTSKTTMVTDLVYEFGDSLYSYAFQQVKDKAVAQDIVQETFISAFQHYEKFKNLSSAKTWLFSILKNKLIDHYRKISKLELESLDTKSENLFDPFDEEGIWKTNSRPVIWMDAEEHLLDNPDFEKVFSDCLSELPQLWSSCMNLKYLSKNESEEICKQLNISTSNLWQIIHRAKLQLRHCLEKKWFVK